MSCQVNYHADLTNLISQQMKCLLTLSQLLEKRLTGARNTYLITDINLTQAEFVLKKHVNPLGVNWKEVKYKTLTKRHVEDTYFTSIKQCFPYGKTGKHWGNTHAVLLLSWKHITSF